MRRRDPDPTPESAALLLAGAPVATQNAPRAYALDPPWHLG